MTHINMVSSTSFRIRNGKTYSRLLTMVLQGCCSSTARSSSPSNPYPNQPHATSSTPIAPQPSSPRFSNASNSSAHHHQALQPSERFNSPLKPHVWKSRHRWTPTLLRREREAFFDTRVSGRQEIWNCVRVVTELIRQGDVETAQGLVDAADITVPTGDLAEGVYDQVGGYYQLPEWVVADPSNILPDEDPSSKGADVVEEEYHVEAIEISDKDGALDTTREEKGKGRASDKEDGLKVKARLSDRATDVVVRVGKQERVQALVERIREEAAVSLASPRGFCLLRQKEYTNSSVDHLQDSNCIHGKDSQRNGASLGSRLERRPCGQCYGLLSLNWILHDF